MFSIGINTKTNEEFLMDCKWCSHIVCWRAGWIQDELGGVGTSSGTRQCCPSAGKCIQCGVSVHRNIIQQ
jgi:hypothetical protein